MAKTLLVYNPLTRLNRTIYQLLWSNKDSHWNQIIIMQTDQSEERKPTYSNLLRIVSQTVGSLLVIALNDTSFDQDPGSACLTREAALELINSNKSSEVTIITCKKVDLDLPYKVNSTLTKIYSKSKSQNSKTDLVNAGLSEHKGDDSHYSYPYVESVDYLPIEYCESYSCEELIKALENEGDGDGSLLKTEHQMVEQTVSASPHFKCCLMVLENINLSSFVDLVYDFFHQPEMTYKQMLDNILINSEAKVRLESNQPLDLDHTIRN